MSVAGSQGPEGRVANRLGPSEAAGGLGGGGEEEKGFPQPEFPERRGEKSLGPMASMHPGQPTV